MSISRREALWGAAGGAVTFNGGPTLGGLTLGAATQEDLPAMFARLDHQLATFREATMSPDTVAFFEARGLPGDLYHTLFSGLLTTSLVRDLPTDLQSLPSVQERLQDELVRVGRGALGIRDLLASATSAARGAAARRLAADPGLIERLKSVMEPWFGPGGIEPERREQVFKGLDQLTWNLTHGDPDAVFDEPIKQVDRFSRLADTLLERQLQEAGSTLGMDELLGTEEATESGPEVAELSLDTRYDSCAEAVAAYPDAGRWRDSWYEKAKRACALPEGGYDPAFRNIRRRIRARRYAAIGGAITGLGIVTVPIYVGVCLLTPGLVLLLVALILQIASRPA